MTTLKTNAGWHSARFWSYMNEGPQQDWDRVYLCSVAPMSAGALRVNEEAERTHRTHDSLADNG